MELRSEEHLEWLKDEAQKRIDSKYRTGQEEHGGYLPEKDGILDEAINEAIDLVVYLLTLKKQNNGKSN